MSLFGFVLLAIGQFTAASHRREPVVYLRILRDRSFGMVFAISLVVGGALYGLLYLIPQFLANVAGYNSLQAGYVVLLSGIPAICMMPLFPWLARNVDIRLLIALGLLCFGGSCFINAHLTAETVGEDFIWPQILRGFGQYFCMLFLNQAATSSVGKAFAEDAAGLFNGARNLGGSFGLAIVSTLQDRRTTLHMQQVGESVSANSVRGQDHLAGLAGQLGFGDTATGMQRAIGAFGREVERQATVMAYGDLFWVFGVVLLCAVPLVLFLKPLPKQNSSGPGA